MALYDDPPHLIDIYSPLAPTQDGGGGTVLNWPNTPSQAACPCSINTLSATTIVRYQQAGITVSHQIGFLKSTLLVTLVRGVKFIAPDTGNTYIMMGLRYPDRAYYDIPQLVYANVMEQI